MIFAPVIIALCAIGACVGSFAATAGLRLARGEQSLLGRSRCDHCGLALSFAQTTPILSYLRSGGACGLCGNIIDPVHLAGEMAGVAIVMAALAVKPMQVSSMVAAVGFILLCASVVDLKIRRLPDSLTLAVAILCLLLSLSHARSVVLTGLVSAAVTFLGLEALRMIYARLRGHPGMGFGDVKLLAALALWLGTATAWMLTLAAALGLIISRISPPRSGRLPFGPMIATAGFTIGVAREAGLWP